MLEEPSALNSEIDPLIELSGEENYYILEPNQINSDEIPI